MTAKGRSQRVAELLREEVAKLLTKGIKDPRLGFVSVMSVQMSPDLHYANVYVSLYGNEKERKSSLAALRNSEGWMKHEIRKFLRMRVIPEVRFIEDDTLDKVYQLEDVFKEIHEEKRLAPMILFSLEEVVDALRAGNSFLITSHVSPDGDSVGSVLGLYHLLRALGKTRITCVLQDPVPRMYQSLPGAKKIVSGKSKKVEAETMILVDVATLARVGDVAEWATDGQQVIVIDHHLELGESGASGFIEKTYAAAGEIVADLFEVSGVALTKEAAHCLYVAQITDTNGFRYSSTNPRSHRIAARLLETGLDVAAICKEVFDVMTHAKFQLLLRVLERMVLVADGRIAYSWLDFNDLAETQGQKEDLEGLVGYARNIQGVQVGAFFSSLEANKTKVSFRSNEGFNSAVFLNAFGGGGHAAAAGATFDAPLDPTMKNVVEKLVAALG